MPGPAHADFAAAVVISEAAVNECLNTYLATFADDLHTNGAWTAPFRVNGAALTLQASTDFELLSVRARLRKEDPRMQRYRYSDPRFRPFEAEPDPRMRPLTRLPTGPVVRVQLTCRFYGQVNLKLMRDLSLVADYAPVADIEADVTAALVAVVVDNEFQFRVDFASTHIDVLRVRILSLGLPAGVQAALAQALQAPATAVRLESLLRRLGQSLRIPIGALPARYGYEMKRPDPYLIEVEWVPVAVEQSSIFGESEQPGWQLVVHQVKRPEPWFSVQAEASRLVWMPLDGCLLAAIDVPGYTSGSIADLRDFRVDDPEFRDCDLAGSVNLVFVEDFIKRELLPVMRDAFIAPGLRLNKIDNFAFEVVGHGMYSDIHGFKAELDLTYFAENPFPLDQISDWTPVDVTATVRGNVYLFRGGLVGSVIHVDLDLPLWVKMAAAVAFFNLAVSIPVVGFVAPGFFSDFLNDIEHDATQRANGQATANPVEIERDLTLPDTTGPMYHLRPEHFELRTAAREKHATLYSYVLRKENLELELSFDGHTVEAPANDPSYTIRKEWGLPAAIWAGLVVPHGLFQDHDPTLRVRWQTFFNGTPVSEYTRDFPYTDTRSRGIGIQTFHMVNPNKVDQEIRITCRFYRSIGATTEDLLNASVRFVSDDPRPDSVKRYVRWSHNVKYWNGFDSVTLRRTSKIHKAPGKGGCRFSNQYLLPQKHAPWKQYDIHYLNELPFDDRFLEKHLDLVCPYCFFGGPDKHHGGPRGGYDFTGVVGKLYPYGHRYVP